MYGVWSEKSIMLLPWYENNLGVRLRYDGANNLGTMLLCDGAINLGTRLR